MQVIYASSVKLFNVLLIEPKNPRICLFHVITYSYIFRQFVISMYRVG